MNEIGDPGFNLSFTLALATGFIPALVVRFAWKREPLNPSIATWIAGVWCFAFFWIFREFVVKPSDPEIMTNGLAWVFVFFTSRLIMTGRHEKQTTKLS